MHKFIRSFFSVWLFLIIFPAGVPVALAAGTATAASGASDAGVAPLTRNGLIAQLLQQISHWLSGAARELHAVAQTILDAPSIGTWWHHMLGTATGRQQLFDGTWTLIVVLGFGLLVQALLRRLLRRPRAALGARVLAHASASAAAYGAPSAVPPPATDGAPPDTPSAAHHLGLLRCLLISCARCVLDLLPLAAFVLAAALLAQGLVDYEGRFQDLIVALIGAYAITSIVMAILRIFITPVAGERLLNVDERGAAFLERWIWRIAAVSTFGLAIADGAAQIGINVETRASFLKLVALLAHLLLLTMVIKSRRPVARWIKRVIPARGPMVPLRNGVADGWAWFAALAIAGAWVVWALGVDDGFEQLVHFCTLSIGVILAARIVGILALGGLSRVLGIAEPGDEPQSVTIRHASRYYPLLRSTVSGLVWIGTVIALLEAWGVGAVHWLTGGIVGRHLASASMTVAVAALVAILVWEWANISLERRLERWHASGDMIRAARLRTLLPMLRTSLFVVILLIVGMTGLNQLGINIGPLLAGASIIGVALGFGSQKLVQDFITGIFLLMENAMQVGDSVTVAGVSGTVEYLSIRTVRLRAGDGSLFIVPFSSVTMVNNTNRGVGNAAVKVSVPFDSDIDLIGKTLKEIGAEMRADPAYAHLILNDLELWGVDSVDGAAVTLVGQIRSLDTGRWSVQREFNRRMLKRFRELGIAVTNPHQRVYAVAGPNVSDEEAARSSMPPGRE